MREEYRAGAMLFCNLMEEEFEEIRKDNIINPRNIIHNDSNGGRAPNNNNNNSQQKTPS